MSGTSQYSSQNQRMKTSYSWNDYLNVKNKEDQLKNFDGQYVPEDKIIRNDIANLLEKYNISEDIKNYAISTMRLIVTFYSKKIKEPYKRNNGWLNLLLPLIKKKYTPSIIFNLFEAIRNQFVPFKDNCEHILRLLFLYHDPELAQFLIRKEISFHEFSAEWTSTLFAGVCKREVTDVIWDNLFQRTGPLIFYLILVIVTNLRLTILKKKSQNKDSITQTIASLAKYIDAESVPKYFSIAESFKNNTPFSFEHEFFSATFASLNKHSLLMSGSKFICLPILADELYIVDNKIVSGRNWLIEFILIDLRPVDEFNAGHYPNAFNLDYDLQLRDASSFADKVDELLSKKSVKEHFAVISNRHFCFMGSGRQEDDMFIETFMKSMLKTRVKYISLLKNGYQGIHDVFKKNLGRQLESHKRDQCLICNPSFRDSSSSLQSKSKSLWEWLNKRRSKKTVDCYSNPQDFEIVSVGKYLKDPRKLHFIEGIQLRDNSREDDCRIFLTENDIHVLRLIKEKPSLAYVISKHPLREVTKLTRPENHFNILKIYYNSPLKKITIDKKQKFKFANKEYVEIIGNALKRFKRKEESIGN